MKELGSEVAQRPDGQVVQQSKSSQSNQPNPNPDHGRTGMFAVTQVTRKMQEKRLVLKRSKHVFFMKKLLNMIGRWNLLFAVTQVTRKVPPKTRSSDDSKSFSDKTDHDRTVKPVVCRDASHAQGHEQSMLNEVDIDFRILGLPHSVVKQAENSRAGELVKKIENPPHRQSLRRDLQQNKAYNPFSTTSKKLIQDVGNVELFELFETDPKTQCKECLSYWSEGIVYCTCGHLLKEIVANRGAIECTLDLLSIQECIIKKGRPHGHRYGKSPEKKEYHLAHNLKKRCIKKHFKGIHNRFLRHPDFRKAMLEHDRDEEVCIKWDDLAEQDFTYRMKESEYFRYKQNWWISLNKSGNTTEPMRKRSDFNQALSTFNRLHREAGGRPLRPTPYWKCQERQSSSSSSSSWWQWSGSWWSS